MGLMAPFWCCFQPDAHFQPFLISMAEADIRLTTVEKNGAELSSLIPAGSMSKQDGKNALAGTWQIPSAGTVTLSVSGKDVKSAESPFGQMHLMADPERRHCDFERLGQRCEVC